MQKSNKITPTSMQTRIFQIWLLSLLLLLCPFVSVLADEPEPNNSDNPLFPPDPGVVYVPPVVVIMGDTVSASDDPTSTPTEIDVTGDGSIVYNTEENVLSLTSATVEVGDSMMAAISYTGSDPLVIVLCDSSTIFADTVIASQADIIITGDGVLVAEAVVPIIGTPQASILFDSVTMYVRSLKAPASVRRRIRGIKLVDENGGPALSGFASADFNKTAVTPPEATYGEVDVSESPGAPPVTINALYVTNQQGEPEVLTEFQLTAIADQHDAVETANVRRELDTTQPMYNLLGLRVGAGYRGIVVQQGGKYVIL